jgi:hypothetical protein
MPWITHASGNSFDAVLRWLPPPGGPDERSATYRDGIEAMIGVEASR